jgi:hypothetical protein
MVDEQRPALLMASHTLPIPDDWDWYVAEGCLIPIIAISVLLSKRGLPRVMVSVRFAIPRVVATSRIEMRLLSETRSVLEYLSRIFVSVGYTAMPGGKAEAEISQFSEDTRAAEARP